MTVCVVTGKSLLKPPVCCTIYANSIVRIGTSWCFTEFIYLPLFNNCV